MPKGFQLEELIQPVSTRRVGTMGTCLLAMVGASGCLFQQKPRPVAFTPPPPHPPTKPEPRPQLPVPPELQSELAIILLPDSSELFPNLPEPPKPVKPKTPIIAGPKPPINPGPDTPTPRLGQIFSAEEIRAYTNNLNASLVRVNDALGKIERRRLTREDVVTVERIKTFQKQAEQARQEDLVTAVNLARRADLLAQDLLGRLP